MKSWSLHNSTKKGFMIFLTVTRQPFMKYHSPPSFSSRNITKNAETHPPPILDVIGMFEVYNKKLPIFINSCWRERNWRIMDQILTLYFWIVGLTELKFTSQICHSLLNVTINHFWNFEDKGKISSFIWYRV